MALDDLAGVIETLRGRMRDYGGTLRENETRTRVALIDPLLCALGWDTADPGVVTPEYNVGGGRADYALHGLETIPAAIVEAKRLGHPLKDDERMQTLNYANARGVRYAAVTDGDVWELYEIFKQGTLEDRRLLDLRISGTPVHECALRLLLLWRPNVSAGNAVAAAEPLVGLPDEPAEPAVVPPPAIPTLAPPVASTPTPPIAPETPGPGWVRLSEFNPPLKTNPPGMMRFSDGSTAEIGIWYRMVVATAQWLHARHLLTVDNMPVPSGTRGFVANDAPVHPPDGRPMASFESIADGDIFINTVRKARRSRENAKKLLEHCGVSPADVWVKAE